MSDDLSIDDLDAGLEKCQITSKSGEGDSVTLEAAFNPKELTVTRAIPWTEHPNVEKNELGVEFTGAKPRKMTVELLFDLFEEQGDVYEKHISKLESLTSVIEGDLGRPPMVIFTWGSTFKSFQGVIDNLTVKYTAFCANGTPCRATATIALTEAERALNKEQGDAERKAAKTAKGSTVKAGDRSDRLAAKAGYPSPRAGAEANKMDDMAKPKVGSIYKGKS